MLLKTKVMIQKFRFKKCPAGKALLTRREGISGFFGRRSQSGFTLIEILMAMTIFSTSFLALAAGATTVMKSNHSSYKSTIATNLAQDKLEEFMSAGTGIPTGCTSYGVSGCSEDVTGQDATTFNRSWQINDLTTDGVTVKEIQIQVTWTDQTNHSVTITSAMAVN